MHKYQPRIHLVRKRDEVNTVSSLETEEYRTFIFPETVFIGVTAYQNQLVTFSIVMTGGRCLKLILVCEVRYLSLRTDQSKRVVKV
jgi:hypothetical protein